MAVKDFGDPTGETILGEEYSNAQKKELGDWMGRNKKEGIMAYIIDNEPEQHGTGREDVGTATRSGEENQLDNESAILPDWDADYYWGDWSEWPRSAKLAFRIQRTFRPSRYPWPQGHPRRDN